VEHDDLEGIRMEQRGQDGNQQPPQDQPGQPAWQDPNQSGQVWDQPQFADQTPYGGQQPQWALQPGPGPQFGGQPPQQVPYVGFQQQPPPKKSSGLRAAGLGCLGVLMIATVVVVAVAVAGTKSGTGVNTTAVGSGSTSAAKATSAAATANKPAGLGATIDVTDSSGDELAVTLVKVDAEATATDGFSSPRSGNQYYAAQFEIKDVGSSAWNDAPSNCTVVKDVKNQTFQSTIVEAISSGPLMSTTANIAAGDSTLGWIVFEVPKGDAVTKIQFTPDSGMADSTAQWSLS
jgi:hypothetical protein